MDYCKYEQMKIKLRNRKIRFDYTVKNNRTLIKKRL